MQRIAPEPPLFRELARRWRPVDKRVRRLTPFQLALAATDAPKTSRSFIGKKRVVAVAPEAAKKSARTWNPWMMTK